MSILIRNGTVVNSDWMMKADVLVEGGLITAVGPELKPKDDTTRIIDATDKYVMPGGIDPHTHLEAEFMDAVSVDDFYYGSRAALAGGTTMFINFILPSNKRTPIELYHEVRRSADQKVCCDYGLSVCLTNFNDELADQMTTLLRPEYGVNSFKFFLAYHNLMIDDAQLYAALCYCKKIGALARIHAENGLIIEQKQKELLDKGVLGPEGHPQSRPEEVGAEAAYRACMIAEQANCPLYVVHVMSLESANCIAKHRKHGGVVFSEVIAAALGTDGSHYYSNDWQHAAGYVMSPPLSTDTTTPDKLIDYLACDEIDLVATDNCTFSRSQKLLGKDDFTKIPNGVNGIEDRMSIVWEKGVYAGKIDPLRFVAITSAVAAKIFNIYPQKGRIEVGSDADIIIWNPAKSRIISAANHHQAVDYNIFEGMEVHGVCEVTISRGKVVWENETLNVEKGAGRFQVLPPFSPYCFAKIPQLSAVTAPRIVVRSGQESPAKESSAEENSN